MTIVVKQLFTASPLRNFSYLIEVKVGHYYCIDPWDEGQITKALGGGRLEAIINTHEHADHTRGNGDLVGRYNCPVWAHQNAKGKILGVDRFLAAGEKLPLSGGYLQVMDTPGHTFAHLCLLLFEQGTPRSVFTGDTLFNAGVGNCHNGGDPETLYKTISQQFQNLPGDVLLYPGHEYLGNNLKFTLSREPSNSAAKQLLEQWGAVDFNRDGIVKDMATEYQVNTFLRLDSREIKDNLQGKLQSRVETPRDVFLALRQLRDKW